MVTVLSRIGLGLILGYCFLVSVLFSFFAQIHVTLPYLPFPIFVGEIVLVICLGLFAVICDMDNPFGRRTAILLGLYFGWVLIKALINYVHDGPLTCRNAALFYYPVFAVFSYCFYQRAVISRQAWQVLGLFAAGILLFKLMYVWYWWTYVVLFVAFLLNTKSSRWRWLGWIFLLVIVGLGKEYLYKGPRAHFVSVLGAVLFLMMFFYALFYRRKAYLQLSILLASLAVFIIGFFVVSNRNDISSLTSINQMISSYKYFDNRYRERESLYKPLKLEPHLYNPKSFSTIFPSGYLILQPVPATKSSPSRNVPAIKGSSVALSSAVSLPTSTVTTMAMPSTSVSTISTQPAMAKPEHILVYPKTMLSTILRCHIREERSLNLDENNIIFRLFVWRDMIHEFVETPGAWLMGFSFGHPQRSRSLEVLSWGENEWHRDGWITPHNSYLHIIYRAGVLGVFFIIILVAMITRLVKDFFRMGSVIGAFLIGGLVYWLVLSNFFVILEFPYNAIIIWTLFGITLAYRDQKIVK